MEDDTAQPESRLDSKEEENQTRKDTTTKQATNDTIDNIRDAIESHSETRNVDKDDQTSKEEAKRESLMVKSDLLSIHKEFSSTFRPSQGTPHAKDTTESTVSRERVASSPKPSKPKRRKKRSQPGVTSGRWTAPEHEAFLRGLVTFGREWKRVAAQIPTRTSAQVRSHAQKYFAKLAKRQEEGDWMQQTTTTTTTTVNEPPPVVVMTESVRREAERIMANPETIEQEVQDILQQLRQRYQQLQERLRRRQADTHSVASSSSVSVQDELIALNVLRDGLRHSGSSSESLDQMEPSKRPRLDE